MSLLAVGGWLLLQFRTARSRLGRVIERIPFMVRFQMRRLKGNDIGELGWIHTRATPGRTARRRGKRNTRRGLSPPPNLGRSAKGRGGEGGRRSPAQILPTLAFVGT